MIQFYTKRRLGLPFRLVAFFTILAFSSSLIILPQRAYAQNLSAALPVGHGSSSVLNLPVPGTMIPRSAPFTPALVKGITIHPDNPLLFDFIVDEGDRNIEGEELQQESIKLIKYFLASLTVPEEKMWVNLSPYEKKRIIPQGFGQTGMGRDLLAQDYLLKQLTASLMYPEGELGNQFWERVYEKAEQRFGTTEIPVNTFNKIWIIPGKAVVYEHEGSAFVLESRLKVMLEEDYMAMDFQQKSTAKSRAPARGMAQRVSSNIIREILIPEIEREVNEGEIFANLRQIYHSMILAAWYKQNLREGLLGQIYIDQQKTKGIATKDKEINQKIYNQYLEAFSQGVYNYIKEDYDPATREIIPRKYFSGGATMAIDRLLVTLREGNEKLTTDQQDGITRIFQEEGNSTDPRVHQLRVKLYEFAEGNGIDSDYMAQIVREIENVSADGARALFAGSGSSPVRKVTKKEILQAKGEDVAQAQKEFEKSERKFLHFKKFDDILDPMILFAPLVVIVSLGLPLLFMDELPVNAYLAGAIGLFMVMIGVIPYKIYFGHIRNNFFYLRNQLEKRLPKAIPIERGEGKVRRYARPEVDYNPGVLNGGKAYREEADHTTFSETDIESLDILKSHGTSEEKFSLYDYYARAGTFLGNERFEWLITHPYLDAEEVQERQEVVRFLVRKRSLRETLKEKFRFIEKKSEGHVVTAFKNRPDLRAFGIEIVTGVGFFLSILFDMNRVLDRLATIFSLSSYLASAKSLGMALSEIPEDQKPEFLREIEEVLSALWRKDHPQSLVRIFRHRRNPFYLHALLHKRRDDFERILGALAELDAYVGLAQTTIDHELNFPDILSQDEPYLEIAGGVHPLFQFADHVPNSITFDLQKIYSYLLTGPNTTGKSTLLKMLATNIIFAQIGGGVAAQSLTLTPLLLRAHINIQDSLADGISKFDLETDLMRSDFDAAVLNPKTLFLFLADEIFEGTNPVDRLIVQKAAIRFLHEHGIPTLIATHDLGLVSFVKELKGATNIHFSETIPSGRPAVNDYSLKPGPIESTNALRIVMEKFDDPVYASFVDDIRKQAGRSSSPVADVTKGGIDFNSNLLNLQIRRDGKGVPLSLPQQPIQNIKIDGFLPVIINVSPANIPMLLGLNEKKQRPDDIGQNFPRDPGLHKNRFQFSDTQEVSLLN